MSKIKIKDKDQIDVTINSDDNSGVVKQELEAQIGLLPQKKGFYPRRYNKFILINFYDTGQIWNGSAFVDIPFLLEPTLQQSTSSFTPVVADGWLDGDKWGDLTDVIYAIEKEDWKENYRRLDYETAEKYGLDIYLGGDDVFAFEADKYFPVARNGSRTWIRNLSTVVSGSKWTAEGLKIPRGANRFSICSNLAFVNTHSGFGNSSVKITAENNPLASAVENFRFDADANIYLIPMPVFEFAYTDPGSFVARYILNAFYTTMPREFYLSRDLDFTGEAVQTGTAFEVPSYLDDEEMQELYPDLIDFLKARSEARHYDYYNDVYETVGDFPLSSAEIKAGHTSYSALSYFPAVGTFITENCPVAVIEKNSEWFWVWNTTDTRPSVSSSFSMLP